MELQSLFKLHCQPSFLPCLSLVSTSLTPLSKTTFFIPKKKFPHLHKPFSPHQSSPSPSCRPPKPLSVSAASVALQTDEDRLPADIEVIETKEPHSRVKLSVIVPPLVSQYCYRLVLDGYAKESKVPGFRPGKKIPESILINYIGKEYVQRSAIATVLKKTIPHAMSSVKGRAFEDSVCILTKFSEMLEAFSPQDFFRYDVVVDVAPEVKWVSEDAYKNLKIVVEIDNEITAQKASEAELRRRHKALSSLRIVTDRGLRIGDVVVLDIFATTISKDDSSGEKIPSAESKGSLNETGMKLHNAEEKEETNKFKEPLQVYSKGRKRGRSVFSSILSSSDVLDSDSPSSSTHPSQLEVAPSPGFHLDTEEGDYLLPGFLDSIIGIQRGETKSFQLQFPESWKQENLQGVHAQFTVECKELFYRDLLELDDSAADKLLPGCSTLSQVKESILQRCQEVEQTARDQATDNAILDQLSKLIEVVDIPQSLFEEQGRQLYGAKLLEQQASRTLDEQQLTSLSSEKALKEYLETERDNITNIIKQMVAVGEIFKRENLQFSTEQLVKEVENSVAEFKQRNQEYDEERIKQQVQDILEGAKVLEWLREHADIQFVTR